MVAVERRAVRDKRQPGGRSKLGIPAWGRGISARVRSTVPCSSASFFSFPRAIELDTRIWSTKEFYLILPPEPSIR